VAGGLLYPSDQGNFFATLPRPIEVELVRGDAEAAELGVKFGESLKKWETRKRPSDVKTWEPVSQWPEKLSGYIAGNQKIWHFSGRKAGNTVEITDLEFRPEAGDPRIESLYWKLKQLDHTVEQVVFEGRTYRWPEPALRVPSQIGASALIRPRPRPECHGRRSHSL
jgi:hypothetical protein